MSPGSPEQIFEERIARLVSEMDDIMIQAREMPEIVRQQEIGLGQIISRAQLVLSFLDAAKPAKFKVISNGKA